MSSESQRTCSSTAKQTIRIEQGLGVRIAYQKHPSGPWRNIRLVSGIGERNVLHVRCLDSLQRSRGALFVMCHAHSISFLNGDILRSHLDDRKRIHVGANALSPPTKDVVHYSFHACNGRVDKWRSQEASLSSFRKIGISVTSALVLAFSKGP